MPTRSERQHALEQMTEDDFKELAHRLGDVRLDKPRDKRIKLLLDDADRSGSGDEYDRAFGLPTDAEQQLELQRKAVAISTSSTRASWASAHATWIIAVCAVLTVIVAIIAIIINKTR